MHCEHISYSIYTQKEHTLTYILAYLSILKRKGWRNFYGTPLTLFPVEESKKKRNQPFAMRFYMSPALARASLRTTGLSKPLVQPRFFTPATSFRVTKAGQSPEEVEKAKQEQLKKQEQGKGEWHEELASNSESRVKADRENVQDHDEHIEDLQKKTAKQAEKEKK